METTNKILQLFILKLAERNLNFKKNIIAIEEIKNLLLKMVYSRPSKFTDEYINIFVCDFIEACLDTEITSVNFCLLDKHTDLENWHDFYYKLSDYISDLIYKV